MILDYDEFKKILNSKLFEDSYSDLLTKISENPDRYIGIFRPTKPKTKLIQNITQSHEIRFGDALEAIFERYFQLTGFQQLSKKLIYNGETLDIDQLFSYGNDIYMIEQKVRDDHDSTKKRGQFDNFESKYFALTQQYPTKNIIPIMWFIDDSLTKNKRFYTESMQKMEEVYECEAHLFYGKSLFEEMCKFDEQVWSETISYLEQWKSALPDMPEVNFDKNPSTVFEEIKDLKPLIYRKLLENPEIMAQIFPIIFPECKVLKLLKDYFKQRHSPVYNTLAKNIDDYIRMHASLASRVI